MKVPRDVVVLFTTRSLRLFGYGFCSVILALYLAALGFRETQLGALFTFALIGDSIITLLLTTQADRIGRRRMLLLGSILILVTGAIFAVARSYWVLALTATLGVLSPSGGEIGPFLSIEQSALTQTISSEERTRVFAWYSLAGSLSTAFGAFCGGFLPQVLQRSGMAVVESYQWVLAGYAAIGLALAVLFGGLSRGVEASSAGLPQSRPASPATMLGLHQSRGIVLRLSALFAMDAFAGGFIVQSLLAYWFHVRFGAAPALLGTIFFFANLLAGVSALSAAWLARRFGLINTMVFTHIPSNILLFLVPLMPGLYPAIAVLLARYSISQMDVPTRQSYTMAVVHPDERSAAAGVTTIARSVGASLSPALAGKLMGAAATLSWPFFLAGGLKIAYDLTLWVSFRFLKPPEEGGKVRQ